MKARLLLAALTLTGSSVVAQNPQAAQQSDSARAANARNLGGGQCNRNVTRVWRRDEHSIRTFDDFIECGSDGCVMSAR